MCALLEEPEEVGAWGDSSVQAEAILHQETGHRSARGGSQHKGEKIDRYLKFEFVSKFSGAFGVVII